MSVMDWKLELVPIPVSDVDAAKRFYIEKTGFALDHDVSLNAHFFLEDPDGNSWAVERVAPGSRRPKGDQP